MKRVKGEIIAVDMDEVLVKLNEKWVSAYNAVFGDSLKVEDITAWDMKKFVKEEAKPFVHGILEIEDFYKDLKLMEDAQRVLELLSKTNEIAIVTDPHTRSSYLNKFDQLQECFPFVNKRNYVFTGNKGLISAKFLIDDGVHNLEVFKGIPILFDAPHNRSETRFYRVLNWQDLYNKFTNHYDEIIEFYKTVTFPIGKTFIPNTVSEFSPVEATSQPQQPTTVHANIAGGGTIKSTAPIQSNTVGNVNAQPVQQPTITPTAEQPIIKPQPTGNNLTIGATQPNLNLKPQGSN